MKKIIIATKTPRHNVSFFASSRLAGRFKQIFVGLLVALIAISCKKNYSASLTSASPTARTFRFQLYTNQDFSTSTSVINFSIFIKNGNRKLFDSSLASMLIKDIPDATHKIVIEKTVADNSDLAAGFLYEIPNVGISWHIDTSRAGNAFKVVDYNFQ